MNKVDYFMQIMDWFDKLSMDRWREIRDTIDMVSVNTLLEQSMDSAYQEKCQIEFDHRTLVNALGYDHTTKDSWDNWVRFRDNKRECDLRHWREFKKQARPLIEKSFRPESDLI